MHTPPSRAFASGSVPPRRGALHHIRHNVLLLLGIYNVPLHNGIIRYAREADWILDDTYVRAGMPPAWWRGDGILSLITNPKDVEALGQVFLNSLRFTWMLLDPAGTSPVAGQPAARSTSTENGGRKDGLPAQNANLRNSQ